MSEEISWFPTLEEYNPNISKEKWLDILDDRNLTTEQNLHILACMYNIGGEATCTQLAQKYGDTKNTYNSGSSNYAKRIVKVKICDEPPLRENDDSRWWPVLYVGHNADSETPGSYVWKLRDELKAACQEYGIEKWLNVAMNVMEENNFDSKRIWKLSHGISDFSDENIDYYLSERMVCVHKETKAKGVSLLSQGKAFTDEAKTGDLFYLCRGNKQILLLGEFISNEIEYDEDGWAYRKYRKLYDSVKEGSYEGPSKWWTPNNNSTFIEIKKTDYSDFEELILIPFFGINLQKLNIESGENIMNENLEKYKGLLIANKNIILHGAPGTGKTYLAKQIAEAMGCSKDEIGFCQFHPSYDYTDFVEGLRPTKNNGFERKDGTFKTFCKKALRNLIDSKKTAEERSQEKSIEEQISSFISDSVDNEIEYELLGRKTKFTITNYDEKKIYISAANKIAKEIEVKISDLVEILSSKKNFGQAKEIAKFFNHPNYGYQSDSYVFALYKQLISVISDKKSDSIESRVEKKTFVFIIDEINRGELSKIFGELFFSIDPGYRGEEGRVNTQYQNLIEDDLFTDGFYIPENVYIIGTMNDIDRSVESMDFAMRRRFTFVEVTAEESAENMKITGEALQKMNSINQIISKMPELGKSYCIGAAYFKNAEDLQKLWDLKISSLVYEYLRGIDNYSDVHKDGEKFDEIKSAYENPDSVVLDK